MKRWNFLALGLVLLLGRVALAQAPDAEGNAQALAVYEEGKRLYDAKDYTGALAKFDEAASLEPSKARWQYNRGLALRKLRRNEEARDAFLQSRTLDQTYKKAEIDDKLREMGSEQPSTSSGSSEAQGFSLSGIVPGLIFLGVPILFAIGFIWMIFGFSRRAKSAQGEVSDRPRSQSASRSQKASRPPMRSVDLAPLDQRMERVASSLVSVEHSLRLEEDADLRAMLNQATMAEQRARDELEQARRGQSRSAPIEERVRAAEESSTAATERAASLFGDKAFLPEGEPVGCYFCARPLANPSFRMQVPLKRGSDVTHVLACPPCANMAAAGQPPRVKVGRAGGQTVHWSELSGYDPYTSRHKPYPGATLAPAWDFTPQRSLAEVAALAAGGALAGGLAAYGVSKLLDLDSAQEAAAAQAASQASARRASDRREERDWRDHS